MTLENEIATLLNRHSVENESDTPDFILAGFLRASLAAFNGAVNAREQWYGHDGLTKKFSEKPQPEPRPSEDRRLAEIRAALERGMVQFGPEPVSYLLSLIESRAVEREAEAPPTLVTVAEPAEGAGELLSFLFAGRHVYLISESDGSQGRDLAASWSREYADRIANALNERASSAARLAALEAGIEALAKQYEQHKATAWDVGNLRAVGYYGGAANDIRALAAPLSAPAATPKEGEA